jgi:hypothetical protein
MGATPGKHPGGRPPDGAKARDAQMHVRIDQEGRGRIDRARARSEETRAAWLRRAAWFALSGMPPKWKLGTPVVGDLHCAGCRCDRPGASQRAPELRAEGFTDAP